MEVGGRTDSLCGTSRVVAIATSSAEVALALEREELEVDV